MQPIYWKLEGQTPVPCQDEIEWWDWYKSADRRVTEDTVQGIWVSTIFMGRDHDLDGNGPPILFETMCATELGWLDSIQKRYATWEEAAIGHRLIVELLHQSLPV